VYAHEIGRKKIRLNGLRIPEQGVEKDRIFIAVEDVTEKEQKNGRQKRF
jgi:hypothetical protein